MRNVLYDRREKIIALLNRDGMVKANELVEQYGVSMETIRRDLEYLEKRGLVDRVYGGAILRKKRGVEPKIEKRQLEHYEEKKAIGQRAVDLVEDGEVIIRQMHISPYEKGNIFNRDPLRPRKLLLHKYEINKIMGQAKMKGYTIVPLKVYFKDSLVKVEIGLARGKKLYDKRNDIAKKDMKREAEKEFKIRNMR